jgi:hypothetical protein
MRTCTEGIALSAKRTIGDEMKNKIGILMGLMWGISATGFAQTQETGRVFGPLNGKLAIDQVFVVAPVLGAWVVEDAIRNWAGDSRLRYDTGKTAETIIEQMQSKFVYESQGLGGYNFSRTIFYAENRVCILERIDTQSNVSVSNSVLNSHCLERLDQNETTKAFDVKRFQRQQPQQQQRQRQKQQERQQPQQQQRSGDSGSTSNWNVNRVSWVKPWQEQRQEGWWKTWQLRRQLRKDERRKARQ